MAPSSSGGICAARRSSPYRTLRSRRRRANPRSPRRKHGGAVAAEAVSALPLDAMKPRVSDQSMLDPQLAGRLSFVHRRPSKPPLPAGTHPLGLSAERDAVLVVPHGLDPAGSDAAHGAVSRRRRKRGENLAYDGRPRSRARLSSARAPIDVSDLGSRDRGKRPGSTAARRGARPRGRSLPARSHAACLRGSFRWRELCDVARDHQRRHRQSPHRLVGRLPIGADADGNTAHLHFPRHPRRADFRSSAAVAAIRRP